MKLTELWTPAECREVLELLGAVEFGDVSLTWDDGQEWEAYYVTDDDLNGHFAYDLGGDEAACILQVAAEQVVRADQVWIEQILCQFVPRRFRSKGLEYLTSGGEWKSTDQDLCAGEDEAIFPTYLAALLASLRAIIRERAEK